MVEQTGHYTVSNVHCSSGVVEAVCKMGGLIGHMCGDSDVINCSVDDYVIRNSRTGVVEEYNIGPVYADSGLYKAKTVSYYKDTAKNTDELFSLYK